MADMGPGLRREDKDDSGLLSKRVRLKGSGGKCQARTIRHHHLRCDAPSKIARPSIEDELVGGREAGIRGIDITNASPARGTRVEDPRRRRDSWLAAGENDDAASVKTRRLGVSRREPEGAGRAYQPQLTS